MDSIGMMGGAFFVGKKEILNWINATLSLNLKKIEETSPGYVAIQIMDIIYPSIVPLNKVKFNATLE